MLKTWTDRQLSILKKEFPIVEDPRKLAKRLRKTYEAMKSKAAALGLKRKFQAGPWTPARDKKLIDLFPKMTNEEIAKKLGLKESQVCSRGFKLGLKKDPEWKLMKSMTTSFKKGSVPSNKGRKQSEYMTREAIRRTKATRFKKGQLPKNTLHDGAITIRYSSASRGRKPTKFIRIALNKWVELQRYNWEKKYGPIPKGMRLWCKNGDRLNCEPDNWELITRKENVLRNSGSLHLKDGYVAFTIVGKSNMDLYNQVLADKKMLDVKRQQLILKKTINDFQANSKEA